ncbi:methyltransferase-like protein 2 isoform X1 [Amborella trichopoda]|uniref:methyltransferase-like protein 2 isoform X1 n=1 Tax=Amborella trichopoda TaxID=13333 RepID=UPI0009C1965F|nr:methyltransferase-like protein 2 isoform X1 [Amborella trichopoda]|eukprot:XP_020530219.1 methyltransferase-like protein 2 isoform X1 [Amborella trichopoda]
MKMEEGAKKEETGELKEFFSNGLYHLPKSRALVMDPVRVLNAFYTNFRVSPSMYYCRSFESISHGEKPVSESRRKRKRKRRPYALNERELAAEMRHQEARPFLLDAHKALLEEIDFMSILPSLKRNGCPTNGIESLSNAEQVTEPSFVELGHLWQAPYYEISLRFRDQSTPSEDFTGAEPIQYCKEVSMSLFNNLVSNWTDDDMKAQFLDNLYILPRKCRFHMSDLRQIHHLIPASSDDGFNLIVIDPPWENRNVHTKSVQVLNSLFGWFVIQMVKKLAHSEGALVALWVTNREKLRVFVEKELLPAWGVNQETIFYWLKIKEDGSLLSDLDLIHHRPYECLVLGYTQGKGGNFCDQQKYTPLKGDQVVISIPGDHSRKPPIGNLLTNHVPGPLPARCLELFARELMAGWTSWGNEPLRFQHSRFFLSKKC